MQSLNNVIETGHVVIKSLVLDLLLVHGIDSLKSHTWVYKWNIFFLAQDSNVRLVLWNMDIIWIYISASKYDTKCKLIIERPREEEVEMHNNYV